MDQGVARKMHLGGMFFCVKKKVGTHGVVFFSRKKIGSILSNITKKMVILRPEKVEPKYIKKVQHLVTLIGGGISIKHSSLLNR